MSAEKEDLQPGQKLEDVGLIEKYIVYKQVPCPDGTCKDRKHVELVNERVFVLDPSTDKIARRALREYAKIADVEGREKLADDLFNWLTVIQAEEDREKEKNRVRAAIDDLQQEYKDFQEKNDA